ncbi:TPA: hypothetical protein ACGOVE_001743 [Streptococcus suis]
MRSYLKFLFYAENPEKTYPKKEQKTSSLDGQVDDSVNYWVYAPGDDARLWEEFYSSIRQISIHDLRDFPIPKLTLEQQQQALNKYKEEMDEIERQLTDLKAKEHHVKRDFYNSMGIAEAFQIVD